MPRYASTDPRADEPLKGGIGKRKRVEDEDEDIDSDEAEGFDSGSDAGPPSPPDADLEDANETVEEKRLRLARDYLRQLGAGDEAGGGSGSDSDGEGGVSARLRVGALRATGRATRPAADAVSAGLARARVTALRGHRLPATCVALAERRGVAVSGGKDSRVVAWDVAAGAPTATLKGCDEWRHKRNPARAAGHVGNILAVDVSADGAIAASGGLDGLVRVWDLRAGKLVDSLRGHRGPVHAVRFVAGTRALYSAAADRTVKSWDLAEMAYVETLFGHGAGVTGVDALAEGRAVSCGQDGSVRLYKIVEGSQLVFRKPLAVSIDAVAMVNDQRFVTGGDDGAVSLWHTSKSKPRASVANAHGTGTGDDAWVASLAAFPYSDLAVSGGGDGRLRFWKCEQAPQLTGCGELDIGPGFVNGIAVGAEKNMLVAAVGAEHRLGRWTKIRGAKNGIRIVKFAEDG